jgi:hypothetical protein
VNSEELVARLGKLGKKARRRLNLRLSEPRQAARIKGGKQMLRRILALSIEGSCVGDAVALAKPFGE